MIFPTNQQSHNRRILQKIVRQNHTFYAD